MSCTKSTGNDGPLISQDISAEVSHISSRCSCLACDSIGCFSKRNKASKSSCQCDTCRNIKNCMSFQKKQSNDKPDVVNDNISKKIVKEVVTRETIESLKKVTETMYEFRNKENYEIMNETQSKTENYCKKTASNDEPDQWKRKIMPIIRNTTEASKEEACKMKPINCDINEPSKVADNAKELSCQIMDVPYDPSSISAHQICDNNPLAKLNIFKRIKEIYDACSCKVCECITSKSLPVRDEFCKCKPCACYDCVNLRNKFMGNIREIPHAGCPCVRCDRKDCRGIVKNDISELQTCDCKPCECVQCADSLPKSCNCEPCQCINCLAVRKVSVAPVAESVRKVSVAPVHEIIDTDDCYCSPCECFHCKHINDESKPNMLHDQSVEMIKKATNCNCENCITEICRLGEIETCKCNKTNINRKLQENCKNYDINTALIDNDRSIFKRHDTIALFASLLNNYYPQYNNTNNNCKCNECECIVCSCKEKVEKPFETKRRSPQTAAKLPSTLLNACKCTPCECEVCEKKRKYHGYHSKQADTYNRCRCDVCDCLNCDSKTFTASAASAFSTKVISDINKKRNCHCSPCECNNCRIGKCTTINGDKFSPETNTIRWNTSRRLKKVLLVTPTVSESVFDTSNYYANVSSTNFSSRKSNTDRTFHKYSTCRTFSRNDRYNSIRTSRFSPDSSFQMNETEDCNKFYTDVDTPRDILFSCSNPPIASSYTSIQGERFFDNSCDRFGETSSKGRNHISTLEEPVKSTISKSEESVPVYWTCRNETNYPSEFPLGHANANHKITESRSLKHTLPINIEDKTPCKTEYEYDVTSCACSSKKLIVDEKTEQTQTSQKIIDNAETLIGDCLMRYLRYLNSYANCRSVVSYNIPKDNIIPPESHSYDDPHQILLVENDEPTNMINSKKHSDIMIDYERATNILRDAKAFSLKLIRMLDSFDKANQQFESASQKFKNLHQSLLDMNEVTCTNKNNSDILHINKHCRFTSQEQLMQKDKERNEENEPERDSEQLSISNPVEIKSIELKKGVIHQNDGESIIESEKDSVQNSISSKSEFVEDYDNSNDKQNADFKAFDQDLTLPTVLLLDNNYISEFKSFSVKEPYKPKTHNIFEERLGTVSGSDIPIKGSKEEDNLKEKERKHSMAIKKIKSVFGNTHTSDISTMPVNHYITKDLGANIMAKQTEPWQILKKNLNLDDIPLERKRKLFGTPPFEFDIKQAVELISLQTSNNTNSVPTAPRANEALARLQVEVNNLLNLPMLQPSSSKRKFKGDVDTFRKTPRVTSDADLKNMSSMSSQTCQEVIKRENKEIDYKNDVLKKDKIYRTENSRDIRNGALYSPYRNKIKSNYGMDTRVEQPSHIGMRCYFEDEDLIPRVLHMLAITPLHRNTVVRTLLFHGTNRCDGGTDPVEHESCTTRKRDELVIMFKSMFHIVILQRKESACEALKASFVGLRRVSDHTVLIRWNLPKQAKDVQGYELLVDGRAVQKIFSPSRTMAVVTCLPHADRVLLTIRTITTAPSDCGHEPATTIVYRPRMK